MHNFDEIIDRRETSCLKWSYLDMMYGNKDLISMWVADSDFKVPQAVIDKLKRRAEHGIFGYTAKPMAFYTVFIEWLKKRHGWEIKKDWMVAVPGIVPAINWAIQVYTKPGDKIIVQSPVYYPFFTSVTNNERVLVDNPLTEEQGSYKMNFDHLESLVDEDTKLLILCNPHNPVGRVWDEEDLLKLGDICLKHNIKIISDEIHADLVYSKKHIPISNLSDALSQITVTCMAPSKTFNVAGLETSVAIIPNEDMRQSFTNFQKNIGLGMINVFGIEAFIACYEQGEEWLEEQLVYLKGNIEYFQTFINTHLGQLKITPIEGTYLLWLDCRALEMDQKTLKKFFIEKAGLALDEGSMFGALGEGFMRFNLATPRSYIVQALDQLKKAVEAYHESVNS